MVVAIFILSCFHTPYWFISNGYSAFFIKMLAIFFYFIVMIYAINMILSHRTGGNERFVGVSDDDIPM